MRTSRKLTVLQEEANRLPARQRINTIREIEESAFLRDEVPVREKQRQHSLANEIEVQVIDPKSVRKTVQMQQEQKARNVQRLATKKQTVAADHEARNAQRLGTKKQTVAAEHDAMIERTKRDESNDRKPRREESNDRESGQTVEQIQLAYLKGVLDKEYAQRRNKREQTIFAQKGEVYTAKQARVEYERRMELFQRDVDSRRITELQDVLLNRERKKTRKMKQLEEMHKSQALQRFLTMPGEVIPDSIVLAHEPTLINRTKQEATNSILRRQVQEKYIQSVNMGIERKQDADYWKEIDDMAQQSDENRKEARRQQEKRDHARIRKERYLSKSVMRPLPKQENINTGQQQLSQSVEFDREPYPGEPRGIRQRMNTRKLEHQMEGTKDYRFNHQSQSVTPTMMNHSPPPRKLTPLKNQAPTSRKPKIV